MATIGGEAVLERKESREAEYVLLTERRVYKIYKNDAAAWASYELYKEAEAYDVPVVSAARFRAPLVDGGSATEVCGIMSERASGQFFQISKAGGVATLIKAIHGMAVKARVASVVSGLKAAAAFGISDAQGFIDASSERPLAFIDVHSIGRWIQKGSKKDPDFQFEARPTSILDDVIATAEKHLAGL